MKELIAIQSELKVTKDLVNSFGGFNYRSAEGILEAVKPLLLKHKCLLLLSDDIRTNGTNNYVEATATIINEKELTVNVKALAREAVSQKGMNDAQLTGSTSSYARKYALSGLFLLDDNKDGDSPNYNKQSDQDTNAHEQVVEKELGGRNLTEEAGNCKNLAELAVWYGNLPEEMKKKGSPAVAVKDNRKAEIQEAQIEADTQTSLPKQEEKGTPAHTFESLKTQTLVQLKEIAKEVGVAGYTKMNKVTLITSIIKIVGE